MATAPLPREPWESGVSMLPVVQRSWPADLDARSRMDMRTREAKRREERWPAAFRIRHVLDQSAFACGVRMRELLGPTQGRSEVSARRMAAVELRKMGLSLPRIGQILGDRHHTTILNLLKNGRVKVEAVAPTLDPFAPDLSGEWAI